MPLQLRDSSQGVANVYGNMVYGAKPNQININHGWKLHAGFVKDSMLHKVLDDVGLEIYAMQTKSGYATPAMRVSNQNKFDTFAKRINNVMGADITQLDNADLKHFMGKFIDLRTLNYPTIGTTDIFRQLDFYEQANAQGLLFKGDATQYGSGRELTFYAGQIERRDKTIQILESQFGDILQDADDIIPGMPEDKAAKNSKISQKTIGRFTTDYLPVDFEDLTKVADGGWDADSMVDARKRGTLGPDKIHIAQTGEIVPETAEELEKMARQYPELGEALRGKEGYVSPYNTIDDLIQQSGVSQTRTGKPLSDTEVSAKIVGDVPGPEDIPPMPTDDDFARYSGFDEDMVDSFDPNENVIQYEEPTSKPKKKPILKVGEETEMRGPARKPKAKPDTTPSARVATAGGEAVAEATQRAPRPKPTPEAAEAAARRAAASRATRRGVVDGASTSAAVASGTKGSNNLRVAAAGAAIGIGAYGINKLRSMGKDDAEYARMLEMQRHYRR